MLLCLKVSKQLFFFRPFYVTQFEAKVFTSITFYQYASFVCFKKETLN